MDLRIYQDEGYLSVALINFLCLMGWSHPKGEEIFNLEEFVKLFDLKRVRKTGPIFDADKLLWMNGEYIRRTRNSELAAKIFDFYKGAYPEKEIKTALPLVKTRIKTLADFKKLAGPLFKRPKAPKKELMGGVRRTHLTKAIAGLEKIPNWKQSMVDKDLMNTVDKNKFMKGEFFMSLRIAIFSSKTTPPVNESIIILGKEETLKRLKGALKPL